MTFPSSLNILTSSIAWIGCTFIFLSVVWSFLSSVPDDLWTFLTFRRGVPFPLHICQTNSYFPSVGEFRGSECYTTSWRWVADSACNHLPYTLVSTIPNCLTTHCRGFCTEMPFARTLTYAHSILHALKLGLIHSVCRSEPRSEKRVDGTIRPMAPEQTVAKVEEKLTRCGSVGYCCRMLAIVCRLCEVRAG